MEGKGKGLLKTTSVFMMISGILGILLYGLLTLILSAGTILEHPDGGVLITLTAVFYTVAAIISLVAGILGFKKAADKKAGGTCMVLGLVNLALCFVSAVMSVIGEGASIIHALYSAVGLVIPSLYVVGAYFNAK